jgi:hypothetical protein
MVNTCREIVRAVIDYGVEKDDWKKTWKADARVSSSTRGSPLFRICNESDCTWHCERSLYGIHMWCALKTEMKLLLRLLLICIPKHLSVQCQECLDRGSVETARAILQHAVEVFPGKKSLYKALAQLERQHGTPEAVAEVLERGVKYCPQVCPISTHSTPRTPQA